MGNLAKGNNLLDFFVPIAPLLRHGNQSAPGSDTEVSATPGTNTFATTPPKKTTMNIQPFAEPPDFSALAAQGAPAAKLYGGF